MIIKCEQLIQGFYEIILRNKFYLIQYTTVFFQHQKCFMVWPPKFVISFTPIRSVLIKTFFGDNNRHDNYGNVTKLREFNYGKYSNFENFTSIME